MYLELIEISREEVLEALYKDYVRTEAVAIRALRDPSYGTGRGYLLRSLQNIDRAIARWLPD